MKQLALGCILYAGNNNDYLPPGKFGYSETDRRETWMKYIASNVGVMLYTGPDLTKHNRKTIFYCPSDTTEWVTSTTNLNLYFCTKNSYSANYSVMDEIVQDADNDGVAGPRKMLSIKSPSLGIMLMEGMHDKYNIVGRMTGGLFAGENASCELSKKYNYYLGYGMMEGSHLAGNNWLFCDGSVRYMRYKDTLTSTDLWIVK
jgi:prepilin-type processing-associated H-X9-DG protein